MPGPLGVAPMFVLYPLIPWVGVMALGYVAGEMVFRDDRAAGRRLAVIGALMIAGARRCSAA